MVICVAGLCHLKKSMQFLPIMTLTCSLVIQVSQCKGLWKPETATFFCLFNSCTKRLQVLKFKMKCPKKFAVQKPDNTYQVELIVPSKHQKKTSSFIACRQQLAFKPFILSCKNWIVTREILMRHFIEPIF